MKVTVDRFFGEIPHREPTLLPIGAAEQAIECRLDTGALQPIHGADFVETLAEAADTVLFFPDGWRGFAGPTEGARGPVALNRVYLTGEGRQPEMHVNGEVYSLGVPAPTTAPTIENATAPATDVDGNFDPPLEEVVYAYTFVTIYGEESAPSPPSATLATQFGVNVTVSGGAPAPTGRDISKIRLYRSATSVSGTTALYFVAEVASTTPVFTHNPIARPIQEPIQTLNFAEPPAGMRGITAMPNGMMAGFTGKNIHFSEPYQPHAWPPEYDLACDYNVVGLVALGSTLVILTDGTPYVAQGTSPESLVMQKVEENLPCVSARSIVDLGMAAVYASHRGLVRISTNGSVMVTEDLFSQDQWRDLNPSSIRAAQHDGRYVFIHNKGATRNLIEVDLQNKEPFIVRSVQAPLDLHYILQTGILFMLDSNGVTLRRYDAPAADLRTMLWRSGVMQMDQLASFGCVQVKAQAVNGEDIAIITRVYADGSLVASSDRVGDPFRLPAILASDWQIEIEGVAKVTRVTIASSPSELIE